MAEIKSALPAEFETHLRNLRAAARQVRSASSILKNQALMALAEQLLNSSIPILAANQIDLDSLPPETTSAFRDRLLLNPARLAAMAESLRQVAALPDPVNEVIERKTLANGLRLRQVRAPLGVIFMIFESRPNVISEAFSMAFKSGNVILLRGGSESQRTAAAIYAVMSSTLTKAGFDLLPFWGLTDSNREWVRLLLERKDMIDVVVPRGGEKLIEFVQRHSLMPIIKHDRGVCHAYVDSEADLKMAVQVVANSKLGRPGACNSLETVLVNRSIATEFVPMLYDFTQGKALEWRVDSLTMAILKGRRRVQLAATEAWDTEYLDLTLNCAVVDGLDGAMAHIDRHGSHHSETIVTRSESKARRFQNEVDAAAVYWNASTRFTDGFEFGLGGEIGISTQKLHARGPVGLRELTTPRWLIDGDGQIRS